MKEYLLNIFKAVRSLLNGMSVTGSYFIKPSAIVTQQYPENRATLQMFERTKCELVMPHNAANKHKCTGCGICEIQCPNGSISITTIKVETEEGKKKKQLEEYHYNLGMCTFCGICVKVCPSDAIEFSSEFELAVFDRNKLVNRLNKPGSELIGKEESWA